MQCYPNSPVAQRLGRYVPAPSQVFVIKHTTEFGKGYDVDAYLQVRSADACLFASVLTEFENDEVLPIEVTACGLSSEDFEMTNFHPYIREFLTVKLVILQE